MLCTKCGNTDTRVVDSRTSDDGRTVRRRRECENCKNRFTTYEKIEIMDLLIEKKWWKIEKYDREKLEESLLKATNKRNISIWIISNLISNLEIKWSSKKTIFSKEIWKDILESLKNLDEVSYIRYASVYLKFETTKDFSDFIEKNLL